MCDVQGDGRPDGAEIEVVVPAQRGPGHGRSPRPTPAVRDVARGAVLHRHARLTNNGRPVFCTPSRAELAGTALPRVGRGTDGKVIYSTREDAEAAARELEALGTRAMRSYLCRRSRRGHFHLTTDNARVGPAPVEPGGAVGAPTGPGPQPVMAGRIPAQRLGHSQ